MGCMAALQGLLHSAEQQLRRLSPDFRIIVSGGGKALLQELGKAQISFESNLVIKGLTRYL